MLYSSFYESPIGLLTIVADNEKLSGIWMENQKYYLGNIKCLPQTCDNSLPIIQAKNWLDLYFSGKKPEIPLDILGPDGSEFRRLVWKLLCEIPYGEVVTYGELAVKVSGLLGISRMSAQAVGGAVGHNPLSIIVPCHRVVGADRSLTGYAGGIDRKIYLLRHEGLNISEFIIPLKGTAV